MNTKHNDAMLNLYKSSYSQAMRKSPGHTKELLADTNQAACTHIRAGTLSTPMRQ